MLETLNNIDTEIFLVINGQYNSFWDFVMLWASNKFIWIPLYLLFLYFLIKNYKWKTLIILVFVAILITLSDQISLHLFKNIFQRLRPCHEPEIADMVHLINNKCGGQFSFISSHAANTFALAVFLIKIIGRSYKYFTPLILLWAILVGYSRIYLGVHYPGDVIAGALLGAALGYLIAKLFFWVQIRFLSKTKAI